MIKEKGQTLIEVVIALATSVGVISAIVVAVMSSLNNTEFTKNQNLASAFSQQGMEIVRSTAKINWASFLTYNKVYYCLSKNSTILTAMGSNGCGQNVDIFSRGIEIWKDSSDCQNEVKVISTVSWSDSKCTSANDLFCHKVKINSCLANINGTQNP